MTAYILQELEQEHNKTYWMFKNFKYSLNKILYYDTSIETGYRFL
jgi:hypothetical protein